MLFRSEGRFVFTDTTAVNLLYIAKVTDPTQFDSLLLHAIAMKLGSEIAEALTGRAELRDRMLSKYLQILAEARGVDSQERSQAASSLRTDSLTPGW